ncbi:GNAT family N-acetyltransferase [Pedobacter nyackensis]|uniref:Acetyltransferase (GNAT) domain-containing protein n=1 Tax=Pedobacter nyackensis TaxID=475255 RepID=A0A1W2DCP9_9SPHI|nr:GNAT family N-acetyltransferase [Pedobacter nyackensis]SMC95221.1 Acetyltransferase (GNAT) domain-containing protein [Pedobacter nyackensis]
MHHLVTIDQKEEWKGYVSDSVQHDFYHTWYYHSLDRSGTPILFVYEEGENYIAFPLIKREIPRSLLYDLTSVYGYTGPISNQRFEDLSDEFLENFKDSFLTFLRKGQHVSVFSRLHPFFDQQRVMQKFGGVHANGKTIAIDLTIPIEDQRNKYHKRLAEKIRQLRRKGYEVREANGPEDIKLFASIYTENMQRIEASDFYLFTEEYFNDLHESNEFNSKLLLVYNQEGFAVCGAFIVCTNDIIQAHLLGTRTAYLGDSPAKLLTDEITVIGREMGAKYFHLGGGLNFKQDSLFEWKACFSDYILDFKSWRFIADQDPYTALLEEHQIDKNEEVDFFPLYRYTKKVIESTKVYFVLFFTEHLSLCII